MASSRSWEQLYPEDSELIGLGASRIRELKDNIQDRLSVGHSFGISIYDDGEHKEDIVVTGTAAGTVNIDLRVGRVFLYTLQANTTVGITHIDNDDYQNQTKTYRRSFVLGFTQAESNIYTVTFPTTFRWHNDTAIQVTTQANWTTLYYCETYTNGYRYIVYHVGDFNLT